MTTELQIKCNPGAWDASVIMAAGVPHDGRTLTPRTVTASDLPPDLLAVWHAAVEQLLDIDPGGWAATHVTARQRFDFPAITYDPGDNDAPDELPGLAPEGSPVLDLTIQRTWASDGTTAEPITLTLDDPHMIAFYNTLTAAEFWQDKKK